MPLYLVASEKLVRSRGSVLSPEELEDPRPYSPPLTPEQIQALGRSVEKGTFFDKLWFGTCILLFVMFMALTVLGQVAYSPFRAVWRFATHR
jgi:hypothetical protein